MAQALLGSGYASSGGDKVVLSDGGRWFALRGVSALGILGTWLPFWLEMEIGPSDMPFYVYGLMIVGILPVILLRTGPRLLLAAAFAGAWCVVFLALLIVFSATGTTPLFLALPCMMSGAVLYLGSWSLLLADLIIRSKQSLGLAVED